MTFNTKLVGYGEDSYENAFPVEIDSIRVLVSLRQLSKIILVRA